MPLCVWCCDTINQSPTVRSRVSFYAVLYLVRLLLVLWLDENRQAEDGMDGWMDGWMSEQRALIFIRSCLVRCVVLYCKNKVQSERWKWCQSQRRRMMFNQCRFTRTPTKPKDLKYPHFLFPFLFSSRMLNEWIDGSRRFWIYVLS